MIPQIFTDEQIQQLDVSSGLSSHLDIFGRVITGDEI